jgi:hypothetical protein
MDTRTTDRDVIEKVLADYAAIPYAYGDVKTQTVFDHERDHYLLVLVGTDGGRRVHGSLIHIDIMGDQVIIQRDGTECGVAPLLARGGIAPERILLAFHPEGPFLYSEVEAA